MVNYLVEQKGFTHYSMRDLIVEEIERRGLEVNRPNMGKVGTDIRKERGPAYFTEVFISRAQESGNTDIVIESIRSLAEAENIQKNRGFIVGVNAPEELRYARITERKSATDQVSFEEFRAQEDAEYYTKDLHDPAQMNVLGVLEVADYTLINEGTLQELTQKIERMLSELATRK